MPAMLTSRRFPARDLDDAIELCFAKGWSDGLPVVPPTADRVEAMLAAPGLAPEREITYRRPPRRLRHRGEGGHQRCDGRLPPRVHARRRRRGGHRRSRLEHHGPATSTAGAAVLMIVNGPIARELDVNAGDKW